MGVRRDAREAAVQYLYQRELQQDENDTLLGEFFRLRGLSPSARRFCESLLQTWKTHRSAVDEAIAQHAKNYELSRLSSVDRNVLRIATTEILFCEDIPHAVAINEAIEIARKFSTQESGKFVNGILDNIRKSRKAS